MAERELLLESTLDSVEVAETAVLDAAREIGFHEDDLHQLGMAVRESMVNAVVHGNRYNARKKVHLSVTKAKEIPARNRKSGAGSVPRVCDPVRNLVLRASPPSQAS